MECVSYLELKLIITQIAREMSGIILMGSMRKNGQNYQGKMALIEEKNACKRNVGKRKSERYQMLYSI